MAESSSRNDWRDSDKAKQHLIKVLQRSGVPLETRTIRAVGRFCQRNVTAPLRSVPLGPLLWSAENGGDPKAPREVDAGALFSEILSFEDMKVVIQAYICIEAKYREGLEWFAFLTPHSTRLPVASNAVYSPLVDDLYTENADDLEVYRLAAVSTIAGITDPARTKASEEHLTQNSCAALADFALHVCRGKSRVAAEGKGFEAMPSVIEEFNNQLGDSEEWRDALEVFIMNLPTATHVAYHDEVPGPHPILLRFVIPILSVNGKINRVKMNDDGEITDIVAASYAVTGERLPKWPDNDVFLSPSMHFPLIVTNPEGIGDALQMAYDYILKVRQAFFNLGARGQLGSAALDAAVAAEILALHGIYMRRF